MLHISRFKPTGRRNVAVVYRLLFYAYSH